MIGATTYRWLFLILAEGTAVALIFRYVIPLLRTGNAYTVADIQHPSPSLLTLSLSPPVNMDIPRFRAGQFAYLRLGRAPWSQERPFTISSSHHSPDCWEFTIRVSNRPGSFTRKLKDLKPGFKVFVNGPHGTLGAPVTDPLTIPFQKRPEKTLSAPESVPGMIGITQGVGITPCLSLLRTLADTHDTRAHSLLVAVRSKNDLLAFRREVEMLTANLSLRIRFAVLSPAEEFFSDTVRSDDLLAFLPAPGIRESYEYVLCGPTAFVTNLYTQLLHIDVPRRKIHTETILSAGPAPLAAPPLLPAGHPSAPMKEVRNVETPPSHRPVSAETGDLHRAIRSLHVVRGGDHRERLR